MQPSVPLESYQTTKIYAPILQVKLRGDVIFHLGSVIILVVSGTLLWLGGRSESSGSVCALRSQSLHFPLAPCAATAPRPDSDEWDGQLSPLLRARIQIDLWCFLTQALKAELHQWQQRGQNTSSACTWRREMYFGPNEEGAFIIVIRLVFCL